MRPLASSWKAWLPTVPGTRHRRDLDVAGKQLLALGRSDATLADLPALVEAFRRRCEASGYSRQFSKVRDAASAFLRRQLTRQHVLYQAVRAIEPLPVIPRYAKHPQGPAAARTIADVLSGEPGRIWWALCCTGMGPDEYFGGKWAIEDDVLHVRGTKRRGRDRLVPLLVELQPPILTVWGFRSALKRSGRRPPVRRAPLLRELDGTGGNLGDASASLHGPWAPHDYRPLPAPRSRPRALGARW